MNTQSDMERILKRIAMLTGILVLVISIFFSYDGFDQSVTGENSGYTVLATLIGITLAVVFTVIEFIFGTNYKELNWTLRGVGLFAYVYSIFTNYLGIKHILGADDFMAWSLAMIIDVYPEPAISWAMGESLVGDLLGNLGKMAFGNSGKPQSEHGYQKNQNHHNRNNHQNNAGQQNLAMQRFMESHKAGKHGVNNKPNNSETPFFLRKGE